MKIVKTNQLRIVVFTAVKNRFILHGRVFVMTKSGILCNNTKLCNNFDEAFLFDVSIHSST